METAKTEEERCQTESTYCSCKKHKDSNFCLAHGGGSSQIAIEKTAASKYQIQKYQARLKMQSTHGGIKDLREEIGLLRMMIETRINACQSDTDLVIQSSAIAELVMKVDKLVNSCHRIESLTGELMDRQSLLEFASGIIDIVASSCDAETADTIAMGIIRLTAKKEED